MSKRIFITGATGLVGSFLLRELLQKYPDSSITALRRPDSDLSFVNDISNRVMWVEGDIEETARLEEVMEGAEVVYHAAALVSFDPKKASRMMRVNAEGTANIVNVALHHGIKKLLHVSSVAAIGRIRNPKKLIDETFIWERSPLNTRYALSKFRAEQEVWRGIAEGLDAVIVNPSIVLGPGNGRNVACKRFFDWVSSGRSLYPSGGNGFVDVRDVATSGVSLMENEDAINQRYIINANNVKYKWLLDKIAEEMGMRAPDKKASKLLTSIAWRLSTLASKLSGKKPILTKETATTASHDFSYDNSLVKKTTNIDFRSIEESIEWVVNN